MDLFVSLGALAQYELFDVIIRMLWYVIPFGLAFVLGRLLLDKWLFYKRALFFASQSYIVLEIKLPKEIFKSPKAMEFFFGSLYQTGGEKDWKDIYLKGQTRPWFSCEICSIEGKLHFFVWTRKAHKNLIEAQLYSQYPGIEIYEVPDYTTGVSFNAETDSLWATEFTLSKPDAFPIKTYVDYGMDKDPKEEYKIDPMAPLLEFLSSSVGPGQYAWIQILLRAHKAEDWNAEKKKLEDKKWALGAEEEMNKIRDKAKPKEKDEKSQGRQLTELEKDTISALERSVTKPGFDVGIRALYLAPKDIFSGGVSTGITVGFSHHNSSHLNGFKSNPVKDANKAHAFLAYKHRGYFYNEFKKPHFVLNTEELATIFHLPSGVVTSTALDRIGSKKAEGPSNLPV